MNEEEIGRIVVNTAISIQRSLGPGLLESVYETILKKQLEKQGLKIERQMPVEVVFDGDVFKEGFRADLIVEKKVILEIKSIEKLNNAHKKQLLTYLKLTKLKLGFLLNFGEELMKDGIVRTINGEL